MASHTSNRAAERAARAFASRPAPVRLAIRAAFLLLGRNDPIRVAIRSWGPEWCPPSVSWRMV